MIIPYTVILHEVAEFTVSKSHENSSPYEKLPVRRVRLGASCSRLSITNPLQHPIMSFCTEGLPGVAESIINSRVFPHGFCDFAIGFAQNGMREEDMLRKINIHQTGLEQENSESI